jgi:hypothetical protein
MLAGRGKDLEKTEFSRPGRGFFQAGGLNLILTAMRVWIISSETPNMPLSSGTPAE